MTSILSAPVTDELEREFRSACEQLARARAACKVKDTPAARQRVADCLTLVNAVLDARNAHVPA